MKKALVIAFVAVALAAIPTGCASVGAGQLVRAGISQFQLGRLDKAKECLEGALRENPSHPQALFFMGRIHHAENSLARAIYFYQCCLDADPGYPEVGKYLRQAQREAGGIGEALRFVPLPPE